MVKISVIVPTYNSWTTLRSCLRSLKQQTLSAGEIVVVDNGSTDQTSVLVSKFFPEVKLVSLLANSGVSGGRNAGIKASLGADFLFFFDHDMVAEKKMLEELVKVAKLDSKIGIVTPKIYYWQGRKTNKRIWAAGTAINLWTGQVIFRGGRDQGQFDRIEEVEVAPAAMLVTNQAISKIKRFDECYFATFEDTDFCFRARKAGFTVYYAPAAVAYHQISPDPADEADRLLSRAYLVGRNRVIFMKRFGRSFPIFSIFVVIFSAYYLWLAVKSRRMLDWLRFFQGTIVGMIK